VCASTLLCVCVRVRVCVCVCVCVCSLEDGVVGVVGVSNSIGAPQQHLEGHVGDESPQLLQPPPRALIQETHRHVKRSTYRQREGTRERERGREGARSS